MPNLVRECYQDDGDAYVVVGWVLWEIDWDSGPTNFEKAEHRLLWADSHSLRWESGFWKPSVRGIPTWCVPSYRSQKRCGCWVRRWKSESKQSSFCYAIVPGKFNGISSHLQLCSQSNFTVGVGELTWTKASIPLIRSRVRVRNILTALLREYKLQLTWAHFASILCILIHSQWLRTIT